MVNGRTVIAEFPQYESFEAYSHVTELVSKTMGVPRRFLVADDSYSTASIVSASSEILNKLVEKELQVYYRRIESSMASIVLENAKSYRRWSYYHRARKYIRRGNTKAAAKYVQRALFGGRVYNLLANPNRQRGVNLQYVVLDESSFVKEVQR